MKLEPKIERDLANIVEFFRYLTHLCAFFVDPKLTSNWDVLKRFTPKLIFNVDHYDIFPQESERLVVDKIISNLENALSEVKKQEDESKDTILNIDSAVKILRAARHLHTSITTLEKHFLPQKVRCQEVTEEPDTIPCWGESSDSSDEDESQLLEVDNEYEVTLEDLQQDLLGVCELLKIIDDYDIHPLHVAGLLTSPIGISYLVGPARLSEIIPQDPFILSDNKNILHNAPTRLAYPPLRRIFSALEPHKINPDLTPKETTTAVLNALFDRQQPYQIPAEFKKAYERFALEFHKIATAFNTQTLVDQLLSLRDALSSLISEKQKVLQPIPQTLYLLWCGKHLPKEFAENINTLAARCHSTDWKIKIYTDKYINIFRSLVDYDLHHLLKTKNIEICELGDEYKELVERVATELDFPEEDKPLLTKKLKLSTTTDNQIFRKALSRYLFGIAELERTGEYKNLAAFADIFRLLLLYDKGGMWVDVDMGTTELLDLSAEGTIMPPLFTEYGFLTYLHPIKEGLNNHNIAATPKHPIINAALCHLIIAYINLENPIMRKWPLYLIGCALSRDDGSTETKETATSYTPTPPYGFHPTVLDIKRTDPAVDRERDRFEPLTRLYLTIESSGPGVLHTAVIDKNPKPGGSISETPQLFFGFQEAPPRSITSACGWQTVHCANGWLLGSEAGKPSCESMW